MPHSQIRFAGTTDEELHLMVKEYLAFEESGRLANDALLREKAHNYGPGVMGFVAAALGVYRELYERREIL